MDQQKQKKRRVIQNSKLGKKQTNKRFYEEWETVCIEIRNILRKFLITTIKISEYDQIYSDDCFIKYIDQEYLKQRRAQHLLYEELKNTPDYRRLGTFLSLLSKIQTTNERLGLLKRLPKATELMDLPNTILVRIFQFLDLRKRLVLSRMNKRIEQIIYRSPTHQTLNFKIPFFQFAIQESREIIKQFANLKAIKLSQRESGSISFLKTLMKKNPNLKKIELDKISEEGFNILTKFQRLESLKMNNYCSFTSAFTKLTNLKVLDLSEFKSKKLKLPTKCLSFLTKLEELKLPKISCLQNVASDLVPLTCLKSLSLLSPIFNIQILTQLTSLNLYIQDNTESYPNNSSIDIDDLFQNNLNNVHSSNFLNGIKFKNDKDNVNINITNNNKKKNFENQFHLSLLTNIQKLVILPKMKKKQDKKNNVSKYSYPKITKYLYDLPSNLMYLRIFNFNCNSFLNYYNNLTNLSTLILSNCNLTYLSSQIMNCVSLTKLNLSHNHINSIDDSIIKLRKLKILNLSHNPILIFPKKISKLSFLSKLKLTSSLEKIFGTDFYSENDLKDLLLFNEQEEINNNNDDDDLLLQQQQRQQQQQKQRQQQQQQQQQQEQQQEQQNEEIEIEIINIDDDLNINENNNNNNTILDEDIIEIDDEIIVEDEIVKLKEEKEMLRLQNKLISKKKNKCLNKIPLDINLLKNLKVLKIDRNLINVFPFFLNQNKIIKIKANDNIIHNKIKFKNCNKLKKINFSNNFISRISINNNNKLHTIKMLNNPIKIIKLKSLPRLERIYFSSCLITKFEDSCFMNTHCLNFVEINHCKQLKRLPKIFFLNHRFLTTLNLSQNGLTTIDGLQHLTNLTSLNLSHNLITKIPSFTQRNLLYINLSNNKLSKFRNIKILSKVKLVNLQSNNLSHLSNNFKYLFNLKNLYLRYNKIEIIPDHLAKCSKLLFLDISNNNLHKITHKLFKCKKLCFIKLSYNPRLKSIPVHIRKETSLLLNYLETQYYKKKQSKEK
ncbi:leucine rich repeat containing protein [Anaeramoeba flamelloides]|uniref:Leucine rich repeat containing protein n=1 Tax=Anaeramoeba flamelloides TaxID=1746091 RepID=A0ABQ8YZ32_9EUKA|nr:leucine rich repeat containing protein [Anaeramoeba flamelloides]